MFLNGLFKLCGYKYIIAFLNSASINIYKYIMASKFLSIELLALIFVFLIGNANAYTNQGTYFACDSCSDCSNALNDDTLYEVKLTANITNFAGICINNPANFNNKTFDCQGYTIDGVDNVNTYGIYLNGKTGNTIKNCIVTDFYYGIYLNSSSNNNTLTNNTANTNTFGIHLEFSSNNTLTNNTANTNTFGIALQSSSNNNNLTNNTANTNTFGIYLEYSSNNNITNNTANTNTYGIFLYSSSNNTLTNNTANSNNESGIFLYLSSFNQFSTNRLENNSQTCTYPYGLGYGAGNCGAIHLIATSTNNTFTDNIVTNNYRHGLFVNDTNSTDNIINTNTFCSNNQNQTNHKDIYDEDNTVGNNNTCQTTYNYNDTGEIGCTYCCGSSYTYYKDDDNDTYGNRTNNYTTCNSTTPANYTNNTLSFDCNDNNASINPNVNETYGNDIDENCDGSAPRCGNNACDSSYETCSSCSTDCGSCPSSGGASHTNPIFFKKFTTDLIANQQICFTTYKYNLIVYLDKQNIGVVSENQTFCFTKPSGTYELTLLGGNYNETRFFTVKTAEEPTEPVKPTNDNHCGDKTCNNNETCASCEKDCACPKSMTCKDGVCVTQLYCGDKICNNNETCSTCENDCGACLPPKQVPCALFGLNFGKFIVCWYWWLLLFLILPVGHYAYKKYKQNKEKRNI